MKRTTVKIPDAVDARLRHEARRRGMTVSELTREALEAHLGVGAGRPHLRAAAGSFRSGTDDRSIRVDEIIAKELERERAESRS